MSKRQRSRPIACDKHFDQLERWLEMESDAELKRIADRQDRISDADAERTGETLLDLAVEDRAAGLGGRFLLTLVKRNRSLALPWNRLRVGSPVAVSSADQSEIFHGVVSRRSTTSIQIAVEDWPDADTLRLDLAADELTRRRQQAALAEVRLAGGRLRKLRDVLLFEQDPRFRTNDDCRSPTSLNESQQQAVALSLAAEDVAVIHGPPGTGKTTTVVEFIRQAVAEGQRVLACAPSNTAVDNMLERLVEAGVRTVRLGHPARVTESMRAHSLDLLVEQHDNMNVVRDMLREAESLLRQAGKHSRAKPQPGARQALRREARRLRKDARLLEQQAVEHILDRADVLCATTSLNTELIGQRQFETVVIDEACQTTEAACWIPLQFAGRLVLAGDHCQLPPTVISAEAEREGLGRSLLERLVEGYGDSITRRLDVQYRMHRDIVRFSSERFYDGQLQSHPSVAEHLLPDLPNVADGELVREPVTFIDTAGAGWDEETEPDGESRRNPEEAQLILRRLVSLVESGVDPRQIAVIAPYAAQVRLLREHCSEPLVEIDTVDGFQGREKEAVLITLVRSNREGQIGFLADTRRMNVALTRARRKLLVVGDSSTLGGHEFYQQLLKYFESVGAYHTVWEEM